MSFEIKRTPSEIEVTYDKASEKIGIGSMWPGMTFEEGVIATIDWLTGRREDPPMEDDLG